MGGPGSARSEQAWRHAHRALDHGQARAACRNRDQLRTLSVDIQDFAAVFVGLQEKRHQADYDPVIRLSKRDVAESIDMAEDVLSRFDAAPQADRCAFIALALFRARA